ncbi:MAG: electron transfer flavoprotein subunit alpha/FixB family protein [Erysipelotrichaceae bacterium]|nr:electron transfer flavoprotein subunit alpha/FixB family protein [Erysipelotrichaceae bacterium]
MNKTIWLIAGDFGHICGMKEAAAKTADTVKMIAAGGKQLAEEASKANPDELWWYDDSDVPAECFAGDIAERIASDRPQAILCLDDPVSRTLWAAAAVKAGAVAVGTLFALECGETNRAKRLTADGRSVETVETVGILAGIYDGNDAEPEGETAEIIRAVANANAALQYPADAAETVTEENGLKNAKRVVGVGYGVGSKSELDAVREFAELIDAQIGCSLPVANQLQWFDEHQVVGITHNRIAPELYVALGISGQPQHMSGVRDAKCIVGINIDPDAPIFKKCDYGIVGDVNTLLPLLSEEAKKLQKGK